MVVYRSSGAGTSFAPQLVELTDRVLPNARHPSPVPHRPGEPVRRGRPPRVAPASPTRTEEDPFFRHIVGSLRNGVIAFHRDGTLALMNDEAYRIFALTRRPGDIGRPFTEVLQERPAVIRVLSGRVRD